jgi:integrase
MDHSRPISGHVFRVDGARGPVWRAKYRLPDGRQVQKKLGPAWTGRGRPAAGYYTKRTAEQWLDQILASARDGTLPGLQRTGVTVSKAVEEFLRYVERDRQRKASTVRDYRSVLANHVVPTFGDTQIEDVTPEAVERWARSLGGESSMSNRTKAKVVTVFHGVMERARRVWKLSLNPLRDIEKPRAAASPGIDVLSAEEVMALVRAAEVEQDAAIFLAAAFTGLRQGELIALRWRDVDFPGQHIRVTASYTNGVLSSPKSGKVRAVPMAPAVAQALARLATQGEGRQDDGLVFPGLGGAYLDASALLKRYKRTLTRAGLRPLRFHDLRHTFGTRMIAKADIVRVQEWMGHADMETTRKYLHFAPRPDDAALVAEAFSLDKAVSEFAAGSGSVARRA